MSLKFYGPHGMAKETLASGAPIPEGDYFTLEKGDVSDPHNLRLIKEGKIIPATDAAEKAATSAQTEADKQAEQKEAARQEALAQERAEFDAAVHADPANIESQQNGGE
jgi:hypothetical protein